MDHYIVPAVACRGDKYEHFAYLLCFQLNETVVYVDRKVDAIVEKHVALFSHYIYLAVRFYIRDPQIWIWYWYASTAIATRD